MIRKIISTIGIIGVVAMIVVSVIDHITFLDDKPYYIAMGVGFVLFVPMFIRELLSLRRKKEA
ncbi:MAG: hypothetical protein MR503_02155 [Oscillospiraceae bacterium]|nr:hypothetical protein [Oscillospiraceae bacterium]